MRCGSPMPNQPRDDNPCRAIRVDDELWEAAKVRAAERGESVSEAVRAFLRRYTT
jgi:antitoxin component of RelBE/YafQ-DinJ toxin-antitoxin module